MTLTEELKKPANWAIAQIPGAIWEKSSKYEDIEEKISSTIGEACEVGPECYGHQMADVVSVVVAGGISTACFAYNRPVAGAFTLAAYIVGRAFVYSAVKTKIKNSQARLLSLNTTE